MATGFENLGSSSAGYVSSRDITGGKIKFTGVEGLLTKYATLIQLEAKRNLNEVNPIYGKDKNATGQLNASISVTPVQSSNGQYSIQIELLDYYENVDLGRKPNSKRPPIGKIRQWIIDKQLRLNDGGTTKKGYKKEGTLISQSKKRVKVGKSKMSILEATAYKMASSIAKRGIKPTYFFTNAVNKYSEEMTEAIANELGNDFLDIVVS